MGCNNEKSIDLENDQEKKIFKKKNVEKEKNIIISEEFKEKKVCLKCGEVYKKFISFWQIMRTSGIPYVKKEYSVSIYDNVMFYFPQGQIKLNSRRYIYFVNYHDKKAVDEVENNRCIMKDCYGQLKVFIGNKYEILSPEKRKEYFPKYFGEDGTDVSEFDFQNLLYTLPNEILIVPKNSY